MVSVYFRRLFNKRTFFQRTFLVWNFRTFFRKLFSKDFFGGYRNRNNYIFHLFLFSSSLEYYWRVDPHSFHRRTQCFHRRSQIFSRDPKFSAEIPNFHQRSQIFIRNPKYSSEIPSFVFLATLFLGPNFHWKPTDFHWETPIFSWVSPMRLRDSVSTPMMISSLSLFVGTIPFKVNKKQKLCIISAELQFLHNSW